MEISTFSMHGVLLIDKAAGYTSQATVSKVKRLLETKKAGHVGSLDPIATGLLPICLGEATKFSQYLLSADKHYRVDAKLGQQTDTGDIEGALIREKPVPKLSEQILQEVLSQFRGNIIQTPPMFSALKYKGKPLYYWARKGIEVERSARPVSIYHLKLLDYQAEKLTLEVKCSKGTYIRTLIDDIGIQLGCGAHVTALRRLTVGQYTIDSSIDLSTLESFTTLAERTRHILPLKAILPSTWPTLYVSEPAAFYLRRGQALNLPNTPESGSVCLLLKNTKTLIGVGQVLKDGRIAPYRLINALN